MVGLLYWSLWCKGHVHFHLFYSAIRCKWSDCYIGPYGVKGMFIFICSIPPYGVNGSDCYIGPYGVKGMFIFICSIPPYGVNGRIVILVPMV